MNDRIRDPNSMVWMSAFGRLQPAAAKLTPEDRSRPQPALSRMAAIDKPFSLASATRRSPNPRAQSSHFRRYFKLAAQERSRLRQSRCKREKPRRKAVHSVDGECRTRLMQQGTSQ
jgi:hypothetical protein